MAKPGRPSKGAEALKHQVNFRLNDADHLTYLKLGGAAWFREQLKACAVRLDNTPTAHRPFPSEGFTIALAEPQAAPVTVRIEIWEF